MTELSDTMYTFDPNKSLPFARGVTAKHRGQDPELNYMPFKGICQKEYR